MWGGYKGTRDADPDVRDELIDMRDFYAATLPDSVRGIIFGFVMLGALMALQQRRPG